MLENNPRQEQADIDEMFIERWSPRAFDKNFEISEESLKALVGAARWAPSSFNDQPWRFVMARREDKDFQKFVDLLVEMNQTWAKDASALGFIFAKKISDKTGKENPMSEFDCGSAWMSLTLQARKDGLYTHGMAGIKRGEVYKALEVPEDDFKVMCAFAVGKKGESSSLPDDLQKDEKMNDRKDIEEIVFYGSFSSIH